jgi:hypothetical protein
MPVKLDDLIVRDFRVQRPCKVYGGFANRRKLEEFVSNGFRPVDDEGGPISFYINRNAAIRYRREVTGSRNILSVLRNLGTTERTRTELRNMGISFDYPKPVQLIQYLLSFGAQQKDSIVLDCFAGSGTTGNAVFRLNEDDGGNRRFVMIELDSVIARDVAAKRIKLVSEGYRSESGEQVSGLGGGFRYCELGEPVFDDSGKIRDTIRFGELARHVYFTETGEPLPRERVKKSSLLGITSNQVAVYLLYNGILEDKSVNGGNILTSKTLALLPRHDGPKVVYAAGSRLSRSRLKREGITFKQTPYAIKLK